MGTYYADVRIWGSSEEKSSFKWVLHATMVNNARTCKLLNRDLGGYVFSRLYANVYSIYELLRTPQRKKEKLCVSRCRDFQRAKSDRMGDVSFECNLLVRVVYIRVREHFKRQKRFSCSSMCAYITHSEEPEGHWGVAEKNHILEYVFI